MATFLSKLFKPKWQNKHLPTRIEAIKELDNSKQEDQEILLSIAKQDTHIDARKTAIQKLSQSEQLIDLHKQASVDTQGIIEKRLYELADAQSLTIFDLIVDPALLTEMIVKSDRPEVFIRGLAHIEDQNALLIIAQNAKTSKIRQAAAELIESESTLQELAKTAKSKDKSVYQIVRNKLVRIKDELKAKQDQNEAINALVSAIQDHEKTENTKLYEAKLESLISRWKAIDAQASEGQRVQFEQARMACEDKYRSLVETQSKKEEAVRLEQAGGDEQNATLLTIQDTLDRFREKPGSAQDASAVDAVIKTQENRWLEATRHSKTDKTKIKHYQVLMTELRHYLQSLKQLGEMSTKFQEALEKIGEQQKDAKALSESIKKLNSLKDLVNWPESYAKPKLLVDVDKALGHSETIREKQKKNDKEIESKLKKLIDELDKTLEERQIKRSAKLQKEIQSLLSQLDARQSAAIHNQLSLRTKQLQELRDWQGYASAPRQQELCEQMERLIEQHISPADKAERIRAMQNEWKKLGGANDHALWERFKTASDKAYEPCKEYFDEQNSLKSANLERRKTLITQLKEFVEETNWDNADWKACDQINRKAKSDWRDAFPVDFKANKPIQAEFNEVISKLDSILDVEKNKNLESKQSIVERASEVAAKLSENQKSLEDAIQTAKALQQDWKAISITDHKKDRKLWKEFRKACDEIFEQRNAQREAKKEELSAAINTFETFLNDMESFVSELSSKNSDEIESALAEFRKQFKQLPSVPSKQRDSLIDRYEKAIKEINTALKSFASKRIIEEWQELKRKSDMCRQVYANGAQSNDTVELDAKFNSGLALSKQIETALKSLWISVKAQSVANDFVIDEDGARNLCIRCEIAAGADSPESDKELRMQLQVSRLSEGMSTGGEVLTREAQLQELLEKWYLKVGISLEAFEPFEQRIIKAVSKLYGFGG